jgi:Putative MetA-pathway of phenol degradation
VCAREFFAPVAVRAASVVVLGIFALQQADAQQAPAGSQQGGGAGPAVEHNDQDFTRPENLFQLRYEYRTAPGTGSVPGTTRTVTTDMVVLRSDLKIDVTPQWTLALRGDLPFVDRNPITAGNPLGEFIDGLGDADAQAALIKTLNSRWAAGAGVRIIAPTGSPDLTSGRWQALPIVGARYMLSELGADSYFTGLVRYDVSFAGDPAKRNISNLQLAPTLNIDLPKRWFVTFIRTRTFG